jgi:hypothetical protein
VQEHFGDFFLRDPVRQRGAGCIWISSFMLSVARIASVSRLRVL